MNDSRVVDLCYMDAMHIDIYMVAMAIVASYTL